MVAAGEPERKGRTGNAEQQSHMLRYQQALLQICAASGRQSPIDALLDVQMRD